MNSSGVEEFMAEARLQRNGYWRDAYTATAVNAYIREGFTPRHTYIPVGVKIPKPIIELLPISHGTLLDVFGLLA